MFPARLRVLAGWMLLVVLATGTIGGSVRGWREAEQSRAFLHARKAQFAARALVPSVAQQTHIREAEQALADALDGLAADAPRDMPRGWREEAYRCELDGSPQPFLRYLPWRTGSPDGLPLLVYLHGYSPDLNLLNWMQPPPSLTNVAESLELAIVLPFGRSNTDFQGIGERDVLKVIDLMHDRYGIDTNQVVLSGLSMGGMGVWTIGARFAERFSGLLPIAARGDYYAWKQIGPDQLPPWRQRLVEDAFPRTRIDRFAGLPILAFHGTADWVIPPREAETIMRLAQQAQPDARLVRLGGADHWIGDTVFMHPQTREWLAACLADRVRVRPPPLGLRPGQTPSRLQNAFLEPFAFVAAQQDDPMGAESAIMARAAEWERFAKAPPRVWRESELNAKRLARYNLFVFGEPEASPIIRLALRSIKAAWTADHVYLAGRRLPRREAGLWLAVPSPLAAKRTLVIQIGVAWGEHLPANHLYDGLPDVLAYRYRQQANRDRLLEPAYLAAGYVDDGGQVSWQDEPGTPQF